MTEAEWLACTDIYNLLEYLRGKASDRKLRLFAVACCQRPYYQVADERHRKAVQLAERMADEDVDEEEWRVVHQAALELWQAAWAASLAAQQEAPRGTPEVESLVDADMATAAGWVILEDGWEAAYQVTGVEWDEKHADEASHQLALLRDIFDNPFRPVPIDSSWVLLNGGIVVNLAQGIYDERAFDRLPILADSLEEAGCHDADILGHCRQPGEHVRGCWVVDSLLGKE
jgi:hypothetical protein